MTEIVGRCFWCDTDPQEAAKHFEGPHATWCPRYVAAPPPSGYECEAPKPAGCGADPLGPLFERAGYRGGKRCTG
jgi:hypothetical protein